jgi:hypothetical protein
MVTLQVVAGPNTSFYYLFLELDKKLSRNVTDNHRPIFITKKLSPSGPESRLQREQTRHKSCAKSAPRSDSAKKITQN